MRKIHYSENPCILAKQDPLYSANRFDVTCKACQKNNNILPVMMDEFIDKTFNIITAVQDDLGYVFEQAKCRFIRKMEDDPLKNYHPWDTETSRELMDYFREEYDEVIIAYASGCIEEAKQEELLDVILTASFLYLKLKKQIRKNKEKSFMGKIE